MPKINFQSQGATVEVDYEGACEFYERPTLSEDGELFSFASFSF